MEPGPSCSRGSNGGGGSGGVVLGGGYSKMPERVVQQMILNPIPGPSNRPYLAQPVHVPMRFLVQPDQLLPHQVKSGIDIVNVFKLLNALQNRIALACGQHQYLRDPLNQPRPPEDGGYRPLTPQAAVRDLRSLCRQQRNLMEKLRRYNCTNDGKCYDLVVNGVYGDICTNCEPFAASRIRMKNVSKALQKQREKARRKALKKLTQPAIPTKFKQRPKKRVALTVAPKPLFAAPIQPPRKRRKKQASLEPPHPETFLSQEDFLSKLGLVTPEVYQKTQAESRRTERRRRTTANPKYSKAAVDANEAGKNKRSRRSDPSSLELPKPITLSSPTGAERRRAKQRRYECTVCEKKDVTIQCSQCQSGFHPECILVTASKAPPPTCVSVCPNCVYCDPTIRSSDCILVSRRMSRPSIMGLKSDQEPGSSGNQRNAGTPRNQRGGSRRRATGRGYSKSARRNAASAKSKKSTLKTQATSKPRKTSQSSKKCYSKRTLNHSLAVAAAAAVPAYCNSTRSSVESTSAQEKATSYQTQRKRKLEASSVENKVGKGKQVDATPTTNDGRWQCTKRENNSATQLSSTKAKETSTVRKKSPMKSVLSASSDERSAFTSKKQPTKSKETQDGVALALKNSSAAGSIQSFYPGGSKTSPITTTHQKVDTNSKLKKTKLEKMEENLIPDESDEQSPSKGTGGKNKKGNGSKPAPMDPFCMKRTMMAMSAAAGIVLSNSGQRMSNGASTPPSPSPVASSSATTPQKLTVSPLNPSSPPPASTSPNNSYSQDIDFNVTNTVEAKMKTVQKPQKLIMLSPDITDFHPNFYEDVKKPGTTTQETKGKVAEKALIFSHVDINDFRKDLDKGEVESEEMAEKAALKPLTNATLSSGPEKKLKVYSYSNTAQARNRPKPAIIAHLEALKMKRLEEQRLATIEAPTLSIGATCVKTAENACILPRSSLDATNSKVGMFSSDAGKQIGPATVASQKFNITSLLPNNTVEKVVKKSAAVSKVPKGKAAREPQKSSTISQPSPLTGRTFQIDEVKLTTKAAKPVKKARKPVPKMNPSTEKSISECIEKVIRDARIAVEREEQNLDDFSDLSKNSYEFTQSPLPCRNDEASISGNFRHDKASSNKWESNMSSNDFSFSYTDFSLNANKNGINVSNGRKRSASPASNSSTIGSRRSLRELSDDSSDDLLSIPDTPLAPYLDLKRFEGPEPFLDFSALDEIRKNIRNYTSPLVKRGRGRGRGGRR